MTDTIPGQRGGVTPGGLPYPDDDDPVMAGAQAIKALAQAIDTRPWYNLVRWTTGTVGGAVDAVLTGWDLRETNYPASLEINDATGGGWVCQLAGLYAVTVTQSWVYASWAGGTQMGVGAKTAGVPLLHEIYGQWTQVGYAGGMQRRTYSVSGLLRVAAGEWVRAVQNNGAGGSVNYSGAAPAGADNRHCLRFSALWVAP
jgi:hypothetical protein